MMHFPQVEAIAAEEAEDRTDKSAELNGVFPQAEAITAEEAEDKTARKRDRKGRV